jgi:hypothetical protein
MILLHIISDTEPQAIEIADLLIEEKLIFDAVILDKIMVRRKSETKKFESRKKHLVLGKTKALLFNDVDKLLRKKYQDQMPDIYSLPIVNMDFQLAIELVSETSKV